MRGGGIARYTMTRKQASPLQGTACSLGGAIVHFGVTTVRLLPYSTVSPVRGWSRGTMWVERERKGGGEGKKGGGIRIYKHHDKGGKGRGGARTICVLSPSLIVYLFVSFFVRHLSCLFGVGVCVLFIYFFLLFDTHRTVRGGLKKFDRFNFQFGLRLYHLSRSRRRYRI